MRAGEGEAVRARGITEPVRGILKCRIVHRSDDGPRFRDYRYEVRASPESAA